MKKEKCVGRNRITRAYEVQDKKAAFVSAQDSKIRTRLKYKDFRGKHFSRRKTSRGILYSCIQLLRLKTFIFCRGASTSQDFILQGINCQRDKSKTNRTLLSSVG